MPESPPHSKSIIERLASAHASAITRPRFASNETWLSPYQKVPQQTDRAKRSASLVLCRLFLDARQVASDTYCKVFVGLYTGNGRIAAGTIKYVPSARLSS